MITLKQINKPLDLNIKAFNSFWYNELHNKLQGDFDWWKIRSGFYSVASEYKVIEFDSADTILGEVLKNLMINKTAEIRIILD